MSVLFYFLIASVALLQAQGSATQKVTLQLLWKHQFEFAGYYMAKEKGYYREAGLDVDLLEYRNGINIAKNVLEGKSNFGIDYSSIILQDPQKVVLVGVLLQSSPHVLVSLKTSGIRRIEDFRHKKIMIDDAAISSAAFIAMLRSRGVSFDEMTLIKPTYDVHDLINKKVDLISAYVSNETYTLHKEGAQYDIWDPRDYGFDLYSNILFTSRKELHEHPKRVAAFVQASRRGWEYAFEHIDETVNTIHQKYNTQHKCKEALAYEAQVLKKLSGYGTKKFTKLDVARLQRIHDIYNVLGYVPKQKSNANLKDMLYPRPIDRPSSQPKKPQMISQKAAPKSPGKITYDLVEKIIIGFGVILLIIGYFYIRLRKTKAAMEKLSLRDPLTNLYNRRYFGEVSQHAFSAFVRDGQLFSIIMLDLDNFKNINDTYGHKFGDTVLQHVAGILQGQSRTSDVVSRFGGEEFIILLRNTNSSGARVHAENIRVKIEKQPIDSIYITTSIGVAMVTENDANIEEVIKRADEALYRAKAKGKNQTVVF